MQHMSWNWEGVQEVENVTVNIGTDYGHGTSTEMTITCPLYIQLL